MRPSQRRNTHVSRRALLAGLLASITLKTPARASSIGAVHFLQTGRNDADGRDWDNAAPFTRASFMAQTSAPDRVFLFGAGAAEHITQWREQQVLLQFGGTEDTPRTLAFGVTPQSSQSFAPIDRHTPPRYIMRGNETLPGERPNVRGAPFIVLGRDSSHLRINGPSFERSGANGFFNLDAGTTLKNLVFSDIHARQSGRVIEVERGTRVEQLLIERCTALGLVRGFARFHDLSDAEFRDLDLDADFLDGGGGAVCQILKVDSGAGLHFSGIKLANAVNAIGAEERGSSYIQGDGIVLEEKTSDISIADCHAEGMGDGGFDLKSRRVHMNNCTTFGCKLGIRIWSHSDENLIEDCTMLDPVSRPQNEGSCLWLAGTLTARNCIMRATDDMSPIRFGSGPDGVGDANLKIQGGEIEFEDEATLITGSEGTVTLESVKVNGVEQSGRFKWTGRQLERQ